MVMKSATSVGLLAQFPTSSMSVFYHYWTIFIHCKSIKRLFYRVCCKKVKQVCYQKPYKVTANSWHPQKGASHPNQWPLQ